jgi:hypothetical protein
MDSFIENHCAKRKETGEEEDWIEFKIKTGGFMIPVLGRGLKKKYSLG